MRARLERAGIASAEAELAIAELTELGSLDDARYARLFAADKRALDSWGEERIARALLGRGIERELVAAALHGGGDAEPGELERAVELLHRRFGVAAADLRACERALGLLVRKGYERELAYDAVREWAAGGPARSWRDDAA
jgi:regulatory protein